MVREHIAGDRAEQNGCNASERRAEYLGRMMSAYFGNLKRHGLIEEANGQIQITRAGMGFLSSDVPPRPQTTEELLELWRGEFAVASASC